VTTLNGNRKRAAQVLAFNVTMLTSVLGIVVPELLTTDAVIQQFLHQLMPHLTAQALISLTFVLLPVPFSLLNLLAGDATLSTLCTVLLLKGATDVTSIWRRGIVTLYLGRFMTLVIAVVIHGKHPQQRNRAIAEPVQKQTRQTTSS
jgi:hypothetical protein